MTVENILDNERCDGNKNSVCCSDEILHSRFAAGHYNTPTTEATSAHFFMVERYRCREAQKCNLVTREQWGFFSTNWSRKNAFYRVGNFLFPYQNAEMLQGVKKLLSKKFIVFNCNNIPGKQQQYTATTNQSKQPFIV